MRPQCHSIRRLYPEGSSQIVTPTQDVKEESAPRGLPNSEDNSFEDEPDCSAVELGLTPRSAGLLGLMRLGSCRATGVVVAGVEDRGRHGGAGAKPERPLFRLLLELRSTDVNGPMLCRRFSVSAGQGIIEVTLGGLVRTCRQVKGSPLRGRAWVADGGRAEASPLICLVAW